MLPLNPILKDAFEKFEQDFLASNLRECKYIKPPASTAKYYQVGQDKLQELNTDFAKILSPLGPLWARFPYKFSRKLNTKLGGISLPSISQLLSQRLPLLVTQLWRSVSTVSRLPLRGLKARSRRVLILKELPGVTMNTPVTILRL